MCLSKERGGHRRQRINILIRETEVSWEPAHRSHDWTWLNMWTDGVWLSVNIMFAWWFHIIWFLCQMKQTHVKCSDSVLKLLLTQRTQSHTCTVTSYWWDECRIWTHHVLLTSVRKCSQSAWLLIIRIGPETPRGSTWRFTVVTRCWVYRHSGEAADRIGSGSVSGSNNQIVESAFIILQFYLKEQQT